MTIQCNRLSIDAAGPLTICEAAHFLGRRVIKVLENPTFFALLLGDDGCQFAAGFYRHVGKREISLEIEMGDAALFEQWQQEHPSQVTVLFSSFERLALLEKRIERITTTQWATHLIFPSATALHIEVFDNTATLGVHFAPAEKEA